MGGFLQTVIFGYGGLRLNVDSLRFRRARLPPGVSRFAVRGVDYLGTEFDVVIYENNTVRLTVTESGTVNLQLETTVPAETRPFGAGTHCKYNGASLCQQMSLQLPFAHTVSLLAILSLYCIHRFLTSSIIDASYKSRSRALLGWEVSSDRRQRLQW